MILQNDPGLDPYIRKYGCIFMVCLSSKDLPGYLWNPPAVQSAWDIALREGAISGDLNHDGDLDDAGEALIRSYQHLFDVLRLPLREIPVKATGLPYKLDSQGIPRLLPVAEPLNLARYWISERWVWKYGHFVRGDGTGKQPPIYDPLGQSLSRLNGHIEDLRVFERIKI